ncbi:hypothetical protein GQ54DRAFT_315119, partial [Martensiomyces pterosporus]
MREASPDAGVKAIADLKNQNPTAQRVDKQALPLTKAQDYAWIRHRFITILATAHPDAQITEQSTALMLSALDMARTRDGAYINHRAIYVTNGRDSKEREFGLAAMHMNLPTMKRHTAWYPAAYPDAREMRLCPRCEQVT